MKMKWDKCISLVLAVAVLTSLCTVPSAANSAFGPQYTVTYLVDGQTHTTERHRYGETFPMLLMASKAGYTSDGWYYMGKKVVDRYFVMPNNDITFQGTLVKNRYTIQYRYAGAVPKDAPPLPPKGTYEYGTRVPLFIPSAVAGYQVDRYSARLIPMQGTSFTVPAGNDTITITWTARTDIAYTVEHYQQNRNDDSYTLADTDHCTGTTDTAAIAQVKSYAGFTVTPKSMSSANDTKIAGDGTTTVKLYYDRTVNTVTYAYSGQTDVMPPALPTGGSYRFGQTVMLSPAPTLPGYDFGGWKTSDVAIAGGSFVMPDAAVTLTGSWTPRADTAYTVEYYQQNPKDDGYTLVDTFHGKGTTGGGIPHKEFAGFTERPDSVAAEGSTKIKSDGSTLVKLYYNRKVNTVSYTYSGDTDITPPTVPAAQSYRFGQTVPVAEVPTLPDYDFGGWQTSDAAIAGGSFVMPDAAVTLTGTWTPRADTAYTVEYYQQNPENDGYTLANTFHGNGTTGGGIPHKEFEGFTERPDSVTAEGNTKIKSDGSTLVKLYYDRNVNAVTYSYSGETDVTPPALPTVGSCRFGQTVTLSPAPTLPGYDFGGWKTSDTTIAGGRFVMPDAAVTLTGNWTPRSDTAYTVEYYQQNPKDDGYTLVDTFYGKGTTGGGIPHKEFEGFTETPNSVTAEGNTKIKSDGSTLVKLYYDRKVNTVTYAYSGATDETPPNLPNTASYRFGQTVPVADAPTLSGYTFSGWASPDVRIHHGSFPMPNAAVTLTGTWTARTDIPYMVEYYLQSTNDDTYTLTDTFCGEGATGGSIPHKEFEGFTETPDSVTAEGNAKIKSDGTTLLKLYYDRNIETVAYAYSGETDATPPELPHTASYRFGQSVPVAEAPTLPGYNFGGWSTADATIADGSFIMPDSSVTLTGAWTTRTDIPYTVEYYWQNAADDDYTLADTFRGKGSVGGSIPHKEFEGFTETPDSVTAEGSTKIKSDGSTLVKLYYNRDRYLVSFAYSGTAPNAAPTLPESALYRFGASVTLPAIPTTISGMNFSGWTADGGRISGNILSVPARNIQVVGRWGHPLASSDDAPETAPVEAVTLEDNGSAYVIGYEDGTFRPDAYLTAKHEALMLSRLGLPVTPLSGGADALGTERYITRRDFLHTLLHAAGVAAESAADPMAQAAALGWISGYTNGELYPNAYITRAQAVVIINRAFGRVAALDLKTDIIYVDLPQDYWAYDAIMAASNIF